MIRMSQSLNVNSHFVMNQNVLNSNLFPLQSWCNSLLSTIIIFIVVAAFFSLLRIYY